MNIYVERTLAKLFERGYTLTLILNSALDKMKEAPPFMIVRSRSHMRSTVVDNHAVYVSFERWRMIAQRDDQQNCLFFHEPFSRHLIISFI